MSSSTDPSVPKCMLLTSTYALQFMLIFRKSRSGELQCEGLAQIAQTCNVAEEGVSGAKSFFEAKVKEQTSAAKFEQEIKEEQERKKREAEESAQRRAAFKEKASMFK